VRVADEEVRWRDAVHGDRCDNPSHQVGDFVVRRADGIFAYQLAVVADDLEQGITEVVRGDDLMASTARQLLLYRALGAAPPAWAHVPLLYGADGARLSKRHGAIAVRECGLPPQALIAKLAATLNLEGDDPRALIAQFDYARLPKLPTLI
jgi:glutamyl-tRNA synthetase